MTIAEFEKELREKIGEVNELVKKSKDVCPDLKGDDIRISICVDSADEYQAYMVWVYQQKEDVIDKQQVANSYLFAKEPHPEWKYCPLEHTQVKVSKKE